MCGIFALLNHNDSVITEDKIHESFMKGGKTRSIP